MARSTRRGGTAARGAAPAGLARPVPSPELADPLGLPLGFQPAPEVVQWIRDTFLTSSSPLHNSEHAHLDAADTGVLWTNASASRQMRQIVGMAEMPQPRGMAWIKDRQVYQLEQWFGRMPDFLITLSAPYAAQADDASWCALVDHELYHCAQALNEYGAPKFKRTGEPIFGMRGHDAEEFVGIVRRYGTGAAAGGVAELVAVAQPEPEIAAADIAGVCGTCLRKAA